MIPQGQIDNNFKYHAPKPGQQEKYVEIRDWQLSPFFLTFTTN